MKQDPTRQTGSTGDERRTLGERLREGREYLGFSQEEIAAYLRVPRSAISLMENGQRRVDALELKRLADLYQRPIGYFAGEHAEEDSSAAVRYLARKVSKLSPDDREELARFADFLGSRKQKKGG